MDESRRKKVKTRFDCRPRGVRGKTASSWACSVRPGWRAIRSPADRASESGRGWGTNL